VATKFPEWKDARVPAAPHRLRQPFAAPLDERDGRREALERANVRRRNLRADRADASKSRQALSEARDGTPETRTRFAAPPTSRSGVVPGTLQTHRPRRQTRPRDGTRTPSLPSRCGWVGAQSLASGPTAGLPGSGYPFTGRSPAGKLGRLR